MYSRLDLKKKNIIKTIFLLLHFTVDIRRPNNLYAMYERSKSFPEEDPYSMPSNSSGGKPERKISDKSRPPRLPPRDVLGKKPPINLPKPDYEVDTENELLSEEQQKTKSDINSRKFGN